MGAIMNGEFGCGLTAAQVARLGQYAENIYFGKPSGLLDQLASALGGVIFADFEDPETPRVEKIHAQGLLPEGMSLCVTDTRGSHSELTAEFAAIRSEMEAVAACFDGCKVLGQVREQDFWARLPALRAQCGDRACLRAAHFFRRTPAPWPRTAPSGRAASASSWPWCGRAATILRPLPERLQRCGPAPPEPFGGAGPQPAHSGGQRRRLADAGGGFAGTIQAFVPAACLARYRAAMDGVFGPGSCHILTLREQGAGLAIG